MVPGRMEGHVRFAPCGARRHGRERHAAFLSRHVVLQDGRDAHEGPAKHAQSDRFRRSGRRLPFLRLPRRAHLRIERLRRILGGAQRAQLDHAGAERVRGRRGLRDPHERRPRRHGSPPQALSSRSDEIRRRGRSRPREFSDGAQGGRVHDRRDRIRREGASLAERSREQEIRSDDAASQRRIPFQQERGRRVRDPLREQSRLDRLFPSRLSEIPGRRERRVQRRLPVRRGNRVPREGIEPLRRVHVG